MNSFLRSLPRVLLWILCGIALSAVFFLVTAPPRGTAILLAPAPSPAPMMIQVEGAVASPGLYALPRESRVSDAVTAAGGLSPQANANAVNLAARLKDGEKLIIPALGTPAVIADPGASRAIGIEPQTDKSVETPGALQPVNLNTATLEELQTLPGIGPTRAEDILAYREQHGGFKTIEELQEVKGIGPATFERLKAHIFVE